MADETARAREVDRKTKLALTILALGAALIGLSLWLSGRKDIRDKFSFDHLRSLIFGNKEG